MPTSTRHLRHRRHRSAYALTVALLAAFCLLQSLYILSPHTHIDSDMRGYVERALSLVQGDPVATFERFYPPGTSIFYAGVMSLFGPRAIALNVIVLLQVGCLVWSAVVAGRTARIIWRTPQAELATLLLLLLFWPLTALGSFFLSEPLFCALFYTAQWLVVAALLRPGRRRSRLVLAGVLYGASALVRGQGMLGLAGSLLWMVLARRSPKHIVQLLLGAVVPLLFLCCFNAVRYGAPSLQIAANDAFNIYLGQSRRAAVSCVNALDGSYYIFHNNNASELSTFLPLELLSCDITDRSYFFQRTVELWKTSPLRQLLVSTVNLFELFTVRPGWPLVAYEPRFARVDGYFQLFGLLCFVLPAALLLLGVVTVPTLTTFAMRSLLGTPLLLFLFTIALSTGQPRYLLPHYYTFIPLVAGLCALPRMRRGGIRIAPGPALRAVLLLPLLLVLPYRAYSHLRTEASSIPSDRAYTLAAIQPPLDPKARFWWFELPVGGTTVFFTPSDGIAVSTVGEPKNGRELSLNREMTVHITIRRSAVDLTRFRLRAALFFHESPRGWGSCLVKVADGETQRSYPVSDIRENRWFSFPLTEAALSEARVEGDDLHDNRLDGDPEIRASVSYQKLSGDTLRLGAVVIYAERLPTGPLANGPLPK